MSSWKIILIVVGTVCILLTALVFPGAMHYVKTMQLLRQYPSEAAAKAALTRNPNDAVAHYTLAKAAYRNNDPGTLLAELETAQRLDPTNDWYKMERSIYLSHLGRKAEALPLLQSITDPNLVPEAQAMLRQISSTAATPGPVPGKTAPR